MKMPEQTTPRTRENFGTGVTVREMKNALRDHSCRKDNDYICLLLEAAVEKLRCLREASIKHDTMDKSTILEIIDRPEWIEH